MSEAESFTDSFAEGGAGMKSSKALTWVHRFFLPTFILFMGTTLSLPSSMVYGKEKKTSKKKEWTQIGKATYYSNHFHGKKTAYGKIYLSHHLVAAHPFYPYGSQVRVTNLKNNRQVEVRIIDRGPSRAQRKKGTLIDLSRAAAEQLRMVRKGRVQVRLEVLKWGRFLKMKAEGHEDDSTAES